MVKKHNYELDLAKFMFSIVILIYHCNKLYIGEETTLLKFGYIATEFFFIVSGYLMVASSHRYQDKAIGRSTLDFIINKIKGFYPYLLIGFVFTFVVRQYVFSLERSITNTVLGDAVASMSELLLLHTSGINFATIYNGPSWYLSSMVVAMILLFPLLLKFKEWYTNIGGLGIAIFTYAFISQNNPTVNGTKIWMHFADMGVLRAIAGLSLGIFLFGLVNRVKEKNIRLNKKGCALVITVELIMYVILAWIMQDLHKLRGKTQFDYIMIILIFGICFIIFSGITRISDKLPAKICSFLGRLSLPIYLNHRAFIYLYQSFNLNLSYKKTVALLLVSTAVACVVTFGILALCRFIRKKLGRKLVKSLTE